MDEDDVSPIRLRAEIVIDIDARDYFEAAEHQRRLDALLLAVKDSYRQTRFALRSRRAPRARAGLSAPPNGRSGRVHVYE
ncbi:MAG: hypothetical protein JSR45_05030 [Proteobacteria bacterium]|nr:hypothetical protein [Pseudomonadota bacterium]